jgi:carboxymethylenebutenolidase
LDYGKKLPASNGKTAVMGFCWGGTQTWAFAMAQRRLERSHSVLRQAPRLDRHPIDEALVAKIASARDGDVTAATTRVSAKRFPATEAAMKKLNKSYDKHIFEGAGHGFMGNQRATGGAISRRPSRHGR